MNQQRFESLKQKYAPVLRTIEQQGVQLGHLHEDNGKLIIAGKAPSENAKNKVWDQIKQIDSAYQDLAADISIDNSIAGDSSASQPPVSPGDHGEDQIYTVKPGDNLSQISKHFYGEASLYMNIFEANRDKLSDPNLIQPGMKLRIPMSGKQVIPRAQNPRAR